MAPPPVDEHIWRRRGHPFEQATADGPRYLGEDASQNAFATFIDVLRARLREYRECAV